EDAIAQDARVVHDAVDATEPCERSGHDAMRGVPFRDAVEARDRFAPERFDLPGDLLRGRAIPPFTFGAAAWIVHDDLRAFLCCRERNGPPDAAARARHDDHFVFQHVGLHVAADLTHS